MPIENLTAARQKLIFLAALLLIVAVSALSFYTANRLGALSARAERTHDILVGLNNFMSDLQAFEAGARGYALTGNTRFLIPREAGLADLDRAVRRLRDLAGEDARLHRRLAVLERLGRRRMALASELVAGRVEGRDAAALVPIVELGKANMDRIRLEVGLALAAEQAEHRRRQLALERQVLVTNAVMALGVLLSLAAIAWLFTLRGREVARRQRAEGELKRFNAELERRVAERTAEVARSRALLDAVIENIPDPIVLKDAADGFRYVMVNQAGERLMSMDRFEIIGHVDHELFPADQATAFVEEDHEVMASGQTHDYPERPLTTRNGVRLIDTCKVPILAGSGGGRFLLGIVRDVTEQRSLEAQLRQTQRMHAVGRLTGGIAHDFNNILAIILGNIDLLREQLAEGTEPAEMADEALAAASHGAELVRRLLAFARMQHLEPTVLDVNARLPSITSLLKRTLGEAIRVQVKRVDGLWPALVDPTQVDDALVNLAINARDAMPHGGSLTIETGNATLDEDYAAHHLEVVPGHYVMLAVSDNGTGMAPAVIARAFEPFFTTKGESGGTGLGLSQVYGWVKQSGGHIKIYSEVGHGTTIKLYLPRADVPREPAAAPAPAADGAAPTAGHETVLVVEDNPKVRATVLRQLADLGYLALEAEDGESALDVVRSGTPFDLMLTDVVMPGGMTGYELAEAARALRPDLKILFTSGYTELAASADLAEAGPLLSKPYRKADLGRAVRAILDGGG